MRWLPKGLDPNSLPDLAHYRAHGIDRVTAWCLTPLCFSKRCVGSTVATITVMVGVGSASAATLTSSVSKEGKTIIALNGEIAEGDSDTLKALIKTANDGGRLVSGLRLNSPGGSLLEGVKLADVIRYAKISTIVANGANCASACFIVFAAGSEKFVSYSASVGVHGASDTPVRNQVTQQFRWRGLSKSWEFQPLS